MLSSSLLLRCCRLHQEDFIGENAFELLISTEGKFDNQRTGKRSNFHRKSLEVESAEDDKNEKDEHLVRHPSHGEEFMSIRVLLIEDEPDVSDFVIRGLQEEGFVVAHSSNGVDGWHLLESGAWDVILLDWWLPGIDGLTLLQRYRSAGHTVPVLFLTARDAVSNRVQGLNAGADDYLCKPFAFEELLARTHALSRRQSSPPSTRLSYDDVSLDLLTHQASRAGEPLTLKAREEALLTYFLKHPEEVLSRVKIYENVWDEQYDGLSNTLEVHVMELRRKLEQHGPRLIHTMRGRGYVLQMR